MDLPEPTDCHYYLITRASLVLTSHLKRALAEAGVAHVRPAYLGVLMSLWKEDGVKMVELGRRAGLEPSSMTGLLDRMERDELVSREPDPDDRRAYRIRLTQRAEEGREAVLDVVDRTLNRALVGLDEKRLEDMKQTLRQLLLNTNKLREP
jgi:DNA-binding MarR family transcriptional regulator